MTSLVFPDVNVWLALLLEDHVHRSVAVRWWSETTCETIAFSRFTQMSVLRLLTTAAPMNGQPLTMAAAWSAYDQLFADDRVAMLQEPPELEGHFRQYTSQRKASPKVWPDAYLAAFAAAYDASVATFDRALARRSSDAILLGGKPT